MTLISKYRKEESIFSNGSIFNQSFFFFYAIHIFPHSDLNKQIMYSSRMNMSAERIWIFWSFFSVNLPYKNRVHYNPLHTEWHHRERKQWLLHVALIYTQLCMIKNKIQWQYPLYSIITNYDTLRLFFRVTVVWQ